MSVQKVQPDLLIETACPLVVNQYVSMSAYETASLVAVNQNVNARFSGCFPTDYAYLQVYTAESANRCCSNNALKKNSKYTMNGY